MNISRLFAFGAPLGMMTAGYLYAQADMPLIPYADSAAVDAGMTLYADNCASCHGADLEGAPNWREPLANGRAAAPPHDETGHTWHHPDELLFLITKYGTAALVGGDYESDMLGFEETLSDDEILSILAYIKSTWPEDVIDRHNTINANASQ